MKVLAVLTMAIAMLWAVAAHEVPADMPPRRPRRAKLYRCDLCGERDSWHWCETCGLAWCLECELAHVDHAEVR